MVALYILIPLSVAVFGCGVVMLVRPKVLKVASTPKQDFFVGVLLIVTSLPILASLYGVFVVENPYWFLDTVFGLFAAI